MLTPDAPHAEVDEEERQQHSPQRPVQEGVYAATEGTLVKAPQRLRIARLRARTGLRARTRHEPARARRFTRLGAQPLPRAFVVDLRLLHIQQYTVGKGGVTAGQEGRRQGLARTRRTLA